MSEAKSVRKLQMENRNFFSSEWPYYIELLKKADLFVDLTYQRPVQEKFVEKLIAEFDHTLVGTLDVSARSDGKYAILDGAQRFEALSKFKNTAWCTIYTGMNIRDEAIFFYMKNRNRRSVHPFYQIRALIAAGDKTAININRIVLSEGYKLEVGGLPDHHLTAIRAIESTYEMSSLARSESLSAALHCLQLCFFGRQGGKEGRLIKGLGRFFQPFPDRQIDWDWLVDRFSGQAPLVLIGRAEDKAEVTRHPAAYHLALNLVEIYNRNRKPGTRLQSSFIEGKGN